MFVQSTTPPLDHELLEGEQALRRLRPELEALVPPFKPRSLHIPHSVSVVLGAQVTIERLLPLMPRYTPRANAGSIARLRDHGLATAFVYHRSLPRCSVEYEALIEAAQVLRRRLLSSAIHLADLGLLDMRRVVEIRAGRGHVGVGDALLALANLFEEHWSRLRDNTPIERSELHRATEQGAKLLAATAERRARRHRRASSDDMTRRALHLMCEVYEEARRVAAYIGWYEPGLHPLPSLVRRTPRSQTIVSEDALVDTTAHPEGEVESGPHLAAAE
jgi:hypothetical protein